MSESDSKLPKSKDQAKKEHKDAGDKNLKELLEQVPCDITVSAGTSETKSEKTEEEYIVTIEKVSTCVETKTRSAVSADPVQTIGSGTSTATTSLQSSLNIGTDIQVTSSDTTTTSTPSSLRSKLEFHDGYFKDKSTSTDPDPDQPTSIPNILTSITDSLSDLEVTLCAASTTGICTCSDQSHIRVSPVVNIRTVDEVHTVSPTKRAVSSSTQVSPKLVKRASNESVDSAIAFDENDDVVVTYKVSESAITISPVPEIPSIDQPSTSSAVTSTVIANAESVTTDPNTEAPEVRHEEASVSGEINVGQAASSTTSNVQQTTTAEKETNIPERVAEPVAQTSEAEASANLPPIVSPPSSSTYESPNKKPDPEE